MALTNPVQLAHQLRALHLASLNPVASAGWLQRTTRALDDLGALESAIPESRFSHAEISMYRDGLLGTLDPRGSHPLDGAANAGAIEMEPAVEPNRWIVRFDARHEGLPGRAHGVFVAGLFDLILARVAIAQGGNGVTVEIQVSFRAPVPIGRPVVYSGRVTRRDGRKAWTEGSVETSDGTDLAVATALVVHQASQSKASTT